MEDLRGRRVDKKNPSFCLASTSSAKSNILASKNADALPQPAAGETMVCHKHFSSDDSLWAGSSLGWGKRAADLAYHRRPASILSLFAAIYNDQNQPAIVMDIAAAQRAVGRTTRVDRILLNLPGARKTLRPA